MTNLGGRQTRSFQADPHESDDSDIQEVVVISAPPPNLNRIPPTSRPQDDPLDRFKAVPHTRSRRAEPAIRDEQEDHEEEEEVEQHGHLSKRRKSSPQLDPIPNYVPSQTQTDTPSIDFQTTSSLPEPPLLTQVDYLDSVTYTPTPIASLHSNESNNFDRPSYSTSSTSCSTPSSTSSSSVSSRNNEYTPLLGPNPAVVGRTTRNKTSYAEVEPQTPSRTYYTRNNRIPNSASAVRPVSGELVKAVNKRRNSASQVQSPCLPVQSQARVSAYAEQPVMWSPRLPSQISPLKPLATDYGEGPRPAKQRIAHKPTIQQNKNIQPKRPLGIAKKVPITLRVKYLDVLIKEYLSTGHPEEESYSEGLKQEQALANRAANKSIYINLIAGLKRKLREKAGISTMPPEDHPKETSNGNKVVSHSDIITGKVTGTFSIEKKRKNDDPSQLSESELYDRLMRYIFPEEQLEAYGYPQPDPDKPSQRLPPLGKDEKRQQLRMELASTYTCERCTKVYRVGEDGVPLPVTGKCIYHPGHLWNARINRSLEKRYSCCKNDSSDLGCSSNKYHVHKGELELANYKGYVYTQPKPKNDPNKHGIFALDCEMCYTAYGLELTRVTVINYKSEVVYEELVKPEHHILDYNTKFSGIKEGDLKDVKKTLKDVQNDLLKMISNKSILIGHSLDSDMKALRIFHKRYVDTAQLFPHKRGLPFKRALRTLMVENLKTIIQEDAGHDSKEDACAAFRLVLWKLKTDVPEKTK